MTETKSITTSEKFLLFIMPVLAAITAIIGTIMYGLAYVSTTIEIPLLTFHVFGDTWYMDTTMMYTTAEKALTTSAALCIATVIIKLTITTLDIITMTKKHTPLPANTSIIQMALLLIVVCFAMVAESLQTATYTTKLAGIAEITPHLLSVAIVCIVILAIIDAGTFARNIYAYVKNSEEGDVEEEDNESIV